MTYASSAVRSTRVNFYAVPFDRGHRICYVAPGETGRSRNPTDVAEMLNAYKADYTAATATKLNWIKNNGSGSGVIRIQADLTVGGMSSTMDESAGFTGHEFSFGRCNYLSFYNLYSAEYSSGGSSESFHSGTIYAFIDSVTQINMNTIDVAFTVDAIMTYYSTGYVDMGECLISRETVGDDTIGVHLEPENVPIGEYSYVGGYSSLYGLTDMCICVQFFTPDPGEKVNGELVDGIFSGGTIRVYPVTSAAVDQIKEVITTFLEIGKSDDILMYMAPSAIMNGQPGVTTNSDGSTTIPDEGVIYTNKGSATSITYTLTGVTEGTGIGRKNYKPNNNKLFTYPYNFLHVTNCNGGTLDLRYEFFDNTPEFIARICGAPPVTVTLTPTGYGGSGTRTPDLMLSLSDYPLCSWSASSFQRWVANNRGQIAMSLMAGVGSMVLGAGIMGAANPAALTSVGPISSAQLARYDMMEAEGSKIGKSGLDSVTGVLANAYDASRQGSYVSGTRTNGNLQFSSGLMNFTYGRQSVTSEQAKVIDDYFSLYGYNVQIGGTPEPNKRVRFDYVQTQGAHVVPVPGYGMPPNDAIEEIEAVFDKGTWFVHNSKIGGKCYDVTVSGNPII